MTQDPQSTMKKHSERCLYSGISTLIKTLEKGERVTSLTHSVLCHQQATSKLEIAWEWERQLAINEQKKI